MPTMRTVLILAALLFAGSGIAQSQVPPQPSSKTSRPPLEGPSNLKQETEKDTRGTEQFPLSVKLLGAGKTKEEREYEARYEEGKAFREWWIIILTGIIAGARVTLVLVIRSLVYYTKNLWASTGQLVKESENSSERQLRAYVASSPD